MTKLWSESVFMVRSNMRDSFLELYNSFSKRVEEKNKESRIKLENNQINIASKEVMSCVVSECLMEDVENIFEFKKNGLCGRYTDFIIRNMCEQVIEYIYIMKHPKLISEYFGFHLKAEWNGTNLFTGLKRTGKARFKNKKSVSEMSMDIGEKESDEEKISLYDIYSIKAEVEHHSYFHHFLNAICDSGDNENDNKEEWDYICLSYILTAFIEMYDTI